MKRIFLLICVLFILLNTQGQNLILNSDMHFGPVYWDNGGCNAEVGFTEDVYGGPSTTNRVAEIDIETCMRQDFCVLKGTTYTIEWRGVLRSGGTCTTADPGITVAIIGVTTGTVYSTANYTYTGPWVWLTRTQNFTIPSGALDSRVTLSVTNYNNPYICGVIIDDLTVSPTASIQNSGPSITCANSNTSWAIANVPSSGVNYNWSFPGASPSSSTLANPTNIQWPSQGSFIVSTVLNNGTCDVTTVTKNVEINCILPVNLLSFNASPKNNTIELQWVTSNEINNDHFVVYRSTDGTNWVEVGTVNSIGLNGGTYTLKDISPALNLNYYQLKQVDKGGLYKYSSVIRVNNNAGKKSGVFVYPSLVSNVLNYVVEIPKAGKLRVILSDISGKNLKNTVEYFTAGSTQKTINVNNLAAGVYLITVSDESNTFKQSVTFKKN